MSLSKTSRYALQAATYLAEHWDRDEAIMVREIADRTGIPRNYLSKLLHQLARDGIVVSERGRRGGFRLAREPARITLASVIQPVDPTATEQHCLLGRETCSDDAPCAAHPRWKGLSDDLRRFLGQTSLAELAQHS